MSGLQITDFVSRGLALHQAGNLSQAEALYRRVLELDPRHIVALMLLGTIEAQRGNSEQAVQLYDLSLKIDPRQPHAHYNRGIVMTELKRFDEALASYDCALALQPDNPVFLNNRGNVLAALKRFDEALASYDRALALQPNYAEAYFNRGSAQAELRNFEQALDSYRQAIAIKPNYAQAQAHHGNVLAAVGRNREAVDSYDRAIALEPNNPHVLNNRGNALADLAQRNYALESYDRALVLKPDYPEALINRGDILADLGRYEDALNSYNRAASLSPEISHSFPYMQGSIACAKLHLCDWSDYGKTVDRIVNGCLAGEKVLVPFGSYVLKDSAVLQHQCGRNFVKDKCPISPVPVWQGERYTHDRIRLAYVSFDFREHLLAHQIAGVIEHHDRRHFETTALSLYPKAPGAIQDRLRSAFERFVDVSDRSDKEVARLVRELEIDILVDLMGHTRGARMGIFAQRPAPIQVNFNCPGTTGADYIDYIVTDPIAVPPEHHPYFSEKVAYLPETFQPNDSKRSTARHTPSRGEAGLPEQGFVFCSFNTSYKFRPAVFDIWMRLLRRFEGSVLWLSSPNSTVAGNLRREAQVRGVNPERLIFAHRVKNIEDHLARQSLADLFLDTLPYNAQTTASDALWAGLPVLTCLGGALSGRVAASALTAVGLPELITYSLEEYEALAAKLTQEPDQLRRIREKLARNRLVSPLFDTARFTHHLEAAFEQMWQIHQSGEAPRYFTVSSLNKAVS